MKILVKFPSRERPQKLLQRLHEYKDLSASKDQIKYLVTLDANDNSCRSDFFMSRIKEIDGGSDHIMVIRGESRNKIDAINRDMDKVPSSSWDILVLASDDMVCVQSGWDVTLKYEMRTHFPDTDGVLFHWDGDAATQRHNEGRGLNTMCILGRKYYERFGYIYHPEYKSLFCDNEFTEVADILDRQYRSSDVLFKHVHFSNSNEKPDNLMVRTQSFYKADESTYNKRKLINFGL